ncbi:MAG: Do family serine endopeptidase [Planctomycetota bacterium]
MQSRSVKHISAALGLVIVSALVTGAVLATTGLAPRLSVGQDRVGQDRVGLSAPDSAAPDGKYGESQSPLAKQDLAAANTLSRAFRNVSEFVKPSVVSINTSQTQVLRNRLPRGFEEFFGVPRVQERRSEGMGSGVVVRSDGYILTNNHVVEGADELEVEFSDGKTASGRIVGTDPQTDLAVIQVERTDLKAIPFGDSDAIEVGDWVLAIGSPFGLDQTVTAGIISGKNRVRGIVGDGEGFEDFLQTDAAINPGNSGGPLVNLRGELVGINTAIMSRSGSSAGVGFAIPATMARPVLRSIIENGSVRRGFLGASLQQLNEDLVRAYDLKVNRGVLIETVLDGMPAKRAGIQPGDVVLSVDGRPMNSSAQMRNYVASRPPGASMMMDINRDGVSRRIRVDLEERTQETMAQFDAGEVMGAMLVPVTESTAKRYGYPNLGIGLIVTDIREDSMADEGDLQEGDVILAAGGVALDSALKLQSILETAKRRNQPCRVNVRRGNQEMVMIVRQ